MRMFKTLLVLIALAGTAAVHAEAIPMAKRSAPLAKIDAATPGPEIPNGDFANLGTVEKMTLTADKNQVITSMKLEVLMDGGATTAEFTVDHPTADQLVPAGTRVQWSDRRHGFYVFPDLH